MLMYGLDTLCRDLSHKCRRTYHTGTLVDLSQNVGTCHNVERNNHSVE